MGTLVGKEKARHLEGEETVRMDNEGREGDRQALAQTATERRQRTGLPPVV